LAVKRGVEQAAVGFSDLWGHGLHPGRQRHGRQWLVVGRRCLGPTFRRLSVGEGFGILRPFPVQVGGGLWWLVTSAGLVLSAAKVRRRAARCQWWLAAAAGCFRLSSSP
jgi:hypothetical protein